MASPFRFEELPPGFVPPRRLYLRGSEKHVSKSTAFPRRTWYHIGTFTAHEDFIPCALSSFPKSTACLSNEDGTAYPAVFWSVYLFSGAEAASEDSQPKADTCVLERNLPNHAVCMFVGMISCCIVAPGRIG